MYVTSSTSVAIGSPESCTDSGDHITYSAATHTMWDKTATFTVQCSPNGTSGWTTVTDYVMQWPTGKIVFNTARQVGTNNFVRINAGSYLTATQLDGSYAWTLSLKAAIVKTTAFQPTGQWEAKTVTVKSGTGQISAWRTDDRLASELSNLIIFVLYANKTAGSRWVLYGHVTDTSPKQSVATVSEQTISFTVEDAAYFFTS